MPRNQYKTDEEKRERYNAYQREYQNRRWATDPEYKRRKELRILKTMMKKLTDFPME
jgi:hypothetical protein